VEPRFLVDAMLGKLARWLVLLGYDAKFAGSDGRSDLELLREALPLVPPKVRSLETPFRRCAKCGRLFWNGTHTERILAAARRLGM
jgi:uncharacterized protein with PIN domain